MRKFFVLYQINDKFKFFYCTKKKSVRILTDTLEIGKKWNNASSLNYYKIDLILQNITS